MRVAIVKGNRNIVIEQAEIPQIEKSTQVVLRVISAAVCNTTDNMIYATDEPEKHWPFKKFPFKLGHECSGYIVEKGEEAPFEIGDRIVYWTVENGAYADYLLLDTADCVAGKIDDTKVDDGLLAIMEMVIGSARHLFTPEGERQIREGDRVLIIGLGPAGLIYTRLALLMGAGRVVCAGRSEFRLNKAKELGAHAAIDTNCPDHRKQILEALGGKADVVIDATGGDVINLICACARQGAKPILYGIPPFNWNERIPELTAAGLLEPVFSESLGARHAIGWCIEMAETNQLQLEKIITHHLPLEELGTALDLCRTQKNSTLKVVIDIQPR